MTEEEANQIIDAVLSSQGLVERLAEDYFLDPRFGSVSWLPTYTRRIVGRIWAIELYRGDRVPDATVAEMAEAAQIDANVQPAFFIPEQSFEHLVPICRSKGIAIIAKVADAYECLIFPGAEGGAAAHVSRVPDWVIDRIAVLGRLSNDVRSPLATFARRFRRLSESGQLNEENQERLVRGALLALLRSNPRFAGSLDPLALVRFFEQNPFHHGKDHYFHTFANLLLGYMVIDESYPSFEAFRTTVFPGTPNWSIEYAWLITVVFHDVGYPIQRLEETSELVFGVSALDAVEALAERKKAWGQPPYVISRGQLVSLYDHLVQTDIDADWTADPFPIRSHPLDSAFERSFLEEGHGVASSMRMLADFFRSISVTASQRQFLVRHIFLSGLSIPFHDWPVRRFLREEGITQIATSRFPFASLLMFIDSLQEDRRGKTQEADILQGIVVDGSTVRAQMNLGALPSEKVIEKKREALDVSSFLNQDLLRFEYPPELLE